MRDKLLKSLLMLLGFGSASCTEKSTGIFGQTDAYGTPTVSYTVKGRVVDTDMKPVQGIKATLNDGSDGIGCTLSDEEGVFSARGAMFGFALTEDVKLTLVLEDIDGEANGSFADESLDVTIGKSDLKSHTTWNSEYFKEIGDVSLRHEQP